MSAPNQNSLNVNINAIPNGFDRARQQYEQTARTIMDGARNFSRNHQQQLRYVEEEVTAQRRNQTAWVADYEERKRKLEEIARQRRLQDQLHTSGNITDREHTRRTRLLNGEQREALQGTGYSGRNAANRYLNQEGQNLSIANQSTATLDSLLQTAREGFRNIVSQDRSTARDMIRAIENDPNATPEQRMSAEMARNHQEEEVKRGKKGDDGFSIAKGLATLAWNNSLQLASQVPQAKNELDLVKPVMSMMGALTGGLAGAVVDLANVKVFGNGLGDANFSSIGTTVGEKAGEMIGGALTRSYQSRDQLTRKNLMLEGMTGGDLAVDRMGGMGDMGGTGKSRLTQNLDKYGLDYNETADLQLTLAKAQGTSSNLSGGAENTVALEKSLGLDRGVLMNLVELQRSSQSQNRDIVKLTTGVLKAGSGDIFKGDRTFLGEFLSKNFTSIQRELLKGQSHVATGTTMDILQKFDKLGGEFGIKDSRSVPLISQINGALTNPGSDNMKALSFAALRRSNPNMGIADLMAEKEKGLASPEYMKSMLSYVDMMGGDDQFKRMNIAGMFGVNQSAAKRIYDNKEGLMSGRISSSELVGDSESNVREAGKSKTGQIEYQTADIENKFIEDVTKAVTHVGSLMTHLFDKMAEEVINRISNSGNRTPKPQQNVTYTPPRGGASVSTNKATKTTSVFSSNNAGGAHY